MYYEQLNDPEAAIKLAKESFDAAIVDLDKVTDENYKEVCLILQLLRDNVTLWLSTNNGTFYLVYCMLDIMITLGRDRGHIFWTITTTNLSLRISNKLCTVEPP